MANVRKLMYGRTNNVRNNYACQQRSVDADDEMSGAGFCTGWAPRKVTTVKGIDLYFIVGRFFFPPPPLGGST